MFCIDPVKDRIDILFTHALRLMVRPIGLATISAAILCLVASRTLFGRQISVWFGAGWVGAGSRTGGHGGCGEPC